MPISDICIDVKYISTKILSDNDLTDEYQVKNSEEFNPGLFFYQVFGKPASSTHMALHSFAQRIRPFFCAAASPKPVISDL